MIALPSPDVLYQALLRRDTAFDGLFITGVRTTGIFCRPTCPAKKPARENVEFFASAREALYAGYRACKRCRPLENGGATPAWLRPLLAELDARAGERWTDADLRDRGLEPSSVRRWFKEHHGMTFHAYHRAQRVGRAMASLREGESVARAAFDNGYESLSAFYDAFRRITGTTPASGKSDVVLHFTRFESPLGALLAAATGHALCLLEFVDRRMLETQLTRLARGLRGSVVPGANDVLRAAETELAQYFAGQRMRFDVPLETPGSEFQQLAWRALRDIPFGETRSYLQQAQAIGRPDAVRAVARANGDNRIAIIIPCHRVVGADGKLTGYGGGLWRKRWLLAHEQRIAPVQLR